MFLKLIFILYCTILVKGLFIKMDLSDVVPDVYDSAPAEKLIVIFPENKEVDFGAELTPTETAQQPEVKWNADSDKLYTVSMVDPDAPSRAEPTLREINHWLVINIKGNDLSTGQILVTYAGPQPPNGTGLHRYIFGVFEQKDELTVTEDLTDRRNFSIRNFANKYNLGVPLAGNYFKAQWDSSVPERK